MGQELEKPEPDPEPEREAVPDQLVFYDCCVNQPLNGISAYGIPCPAATFNRDSPTCLPYMQQVCEAGEWGEGSGCQLWAAQNPDEAYSAYVKRCTRNPFTDECQMWSGTSQQAHAAYRQILGKQVTAGQIAEREDVREACLDNPGACNAAAVAFCEKQRTGRFMHADGRLVDVSGEPYSRFCACINSAAGVGTAECLDNQCYLHGYKMTEQPPTCDMTVCATYWQLKDVGGDIEFRNTSIVQQCGQQQQDDTVDGGGGGGGGGGDDGGVDEGEIDGATDQASEWLTSAQEWIANNKEIAILLLLAASAIIATLIIV